MAAAVSVKPKCLHEALEIFGIVAMRDGRTPSDQKLTWYAADGLTLGRYDAHEGWAKVREMTDEMARDVGLPAIDRKF